MIRLSEDLKMGNLISRNLRRMHSDIGALDGAVSETVLSKKYST
jgi:hypothetical protein